ncbi:hypothetical protein CA601_09820 [Paraburkholderia hospita]|nr:hypothetical protein CA603_31965 [Paraburkholderia hospita]OUL93712.1 hypothetical protein CA601_09820 [Paraburkholderia hospita]
MLPLEQRFIRYFLRANTTLTGNPMPTTVEYLDAVKDKLGLRSDNSASKVLGITRCTVSRYRRRECAFDDEVCFAVAMILDINPFEVVIAAHLERAKDTQTKAKWLRYWSDFSARFTVVRVGLDGMAGASRMGQHGRTPPSRPTSDSPSGDCETALGTAIELLQQVREAMGSNASSRQERRRTPRRAQ